MAGAAGVALRSGNQIPVHEDGGTGGYDVPPDRRPSTPLGLAGSLANKSMHSPIHRQPMKNGNSGNGGC
jgi:hypothetical protein